MSGRLWRKKSLVAAKLRIAKLRGWGDLHIKLGFRVQMQIAGLPGKFKISRFAFNPSDALLLAGDLFDPDGSFSPTRVKVTTRGRALSQEANRSGRASCRSAVVVTSGATACSW
jgi:hypothetical protein